MMKQIIKEASLNTILYSNWLPRDTTPPSVMPSCDFTREISLFFTLINPICNEYHLIKMNILVTK